MQLQEVSPKEGLAFSSVYPKQRLLEQAARHSRAIENCYWFRHVNIDFDLPNGAEGLEPSKRYLLHELFSSIQRQGHKAPGVPNASSDFIIGFHTIPDGSGSLEERAKEINPMAVIASRRYGIDALRRNYTAVVTVNEDIAGMPKRQMEGAVRMLMKRLGAVKIMLMSPSVNSKYVALATMEGGLGVEFLDKPGAIDRLRDRIVMHACAKEGGSSEKVENMINAQEWSNSPMPDYLVNAFRIFGEWGYIDAPHMIADNVSEKRARLAGKLMGYGSQAESAGVYCDAYITVPDEYQMDESTCAILSTASGRYGVDKRRMKRDSHITVVAIVPKSADYKLNGQPHLSLQDYKRYALGRQGFMSMGPSIEFDEIAAAINSSPIVSLSEHPNGQGFRLDPNGKIRMRMARAFFHLHVGVEEISPQMVWFGENVRRVTEYIPANLTDFPFPVGCGKDLTFASSADAVKRSRGAQDTNSGIVVAFFDALNHGTNFVVLTQPLPGTDFIPRDPAKVLLPLIRPGGPIKITQEIAQV